MSMEDESDLDGFLKGLAFSSPMSTEQIRELISGGARLDLRHYSGEGSALCTKAGFDCLESLIFRRVNRLDDGNTYDPEEVLRVIADRICPSLSDGAKRGE